MAVAFDCWFDALVERRVEFRSKRHRDKAGPWNSPRRHWVKTLPSRSLDHPARALRTLYVATLSQSFNEVRQLARLPSIEQGIDVRWKQDLVTGSARRVAQI